MNRPLRSALVVSVLSFSFLHCSSSSQQAPSSDSPVCGNGQVDGSEFCDDGSQNSDEWSLTSHCNASCTALAPHCGDGEINSSEEQCDDNEAEETCSNTCLTTAHFHIHPYLQWATPTSIWILWETGNVEDSLVQWGTTESLGQQTTGTSSVGSQLDNTRIHEVQLTELSPDTLYFYRARTGSAHSDLAWFKTPPAQDAEASTTLVAMSDMQADWSNPNAFKNVINDGVLAFLANGDSTQLVNNVDFAMIPGDLVDNGWNYNEWKDTFFGPSSNFTKHVPIYPVAGNHENDTPYYFQYFHLPENGSDGYEEHWWYFDQSNLRIIGLDSNSSYRLPIQLAWLDNVLSDACANDAIDFVFAQLHHPYKSELWIEGETPYVGDVISRLEMFTTTCGKPSIHFFGHTHGYSRGQSRDHQHLWVNVATAGGNIDYWGEYAQRDYPEFSVTQDEWGFVVVDVDAGDHPKFRLRRISRGNENQARDNELRDDLEIRRENAPPAPPVGISPTSEVCSSRLEFNASLFEDVDGDAHGASHWQVSTDCNDFSSPVVDTWRQHENWFNGEDQEAGTSLESSQIPFLAPQTPHCWRVRYRDRGLAWSQWSAPLAFSTAEAAENLLSNPGAENGLTGWTTVEGVVESLTDGECNGIAPKEGERYFTVGGLCEHSASAKAYQRVAVPSAEEAEIDAGNATAYFGGYLADYGGQDIPGIQLVFRNATEEILEEGPLLTSNNTTWTWVDRIHPIPIGTRQIDFVLVGTRNDGLDNDSYADNLRLEIGGCTP